MRRFFLIMPSVEMTGLWMHLGDRRWFHVSFMEVTLNLDDLPQVMG